MDGGPVSDTAVATCHGVARHYQTWFRVSKCLACGSDSAASILNSGSLSPCPQCVIVETVLMTGVSCARYRTWTSRLLIIGCFSRPLYVVVRSLAGKCQDSVLGRTGRLVSLEAVMTCPHCQTDDTRKLDAATDLGYYRFRCRRCGRRFNERTGTPFNHLEFPTDIVFQVVVFRLLFKLSLRDLVRMFLMRGYEFTHETVREWEERFAPLLAEHLRRKRTGKSWKPLVRRRNVFEGQREMVLSLPSD